MLLSLPQVAARLGVPLALLPYPNPPALCEDAAPGKGSPER